MRGRTALPPDQPHQDEEDPFFIPLPDQPHQDAEAEALAEQVRKVVDYDEEYRDHLLDLLDRGEPEDLRQVRKAVDHLTRKRGHHLTD